MIEQSMTSQDVDTAVETAALQQLVEKATTLFGLGYSKEEVENSLAKVFDLNNPTLRNGFESLCSMYVADSAVAPARTR